MWKVLVLAAIAFAFPKALATAQSGQQAAPLGKDQPSPAPPFRLLWRAATGGQIRGSPVLGPTGMVYATSEDGYLYAWDSQGAPQWKRDLGVVAADSISVSDDGSIYTGLRSRDLVAINPRGLLVWRTGLDGLPVGDPCIASDGTIFVGTSAGTLYAISPVGRVEWTVTLPGAINQPILLDGDGTILVSAADRRLYAFTPWGQFKWSLPLAAVSCPPALSDGGTVILGTDGGDVIAVSAVGDVLWRHACGGRITGLSAAAGQIAAVVSPATVVGLSGDGAEAWRISAAMALDGAALLTGSEIVLVSPNGTLLRATPVSGVTGSLSAPTTGRVTLDRGGRLLLGGRDWVVYCYGLPDSSVVTATDPWPQAGHDQGHSGQSRSRAEAGNLGYLSLLPDYLYLQSLAASGTHDSDLLLLSEVRSRMEAGSLGKSTWYVVSLLGRMAGEGLFNLVYQYNRLINNFADVREQAAGLLGATGSLRSRDELIRLLGAESDPVAMAAQIGSLGALASDPDGASARAIAEAFTHHGLYPPDERLARATVGALAEMGSYRGGWTDPVCIGTLLSIAQGAFSQEVRSDALGALQNGSN